MTLRNALALSLALHTCFLLLGVGRLPELSGEASGMRARLDVSYRSQAAGLSDSLAELTETPSRPLAATPERHRDRPARPSADDELNPTAGSAGGAPTARASAQESVADSGAAHAPERGRKTEKADDAAMQDGIRQYRLNLAREARRYRRFPAMARSNGWEGQVIVVVSTVAGSPLPQASLSAGSGRVVLDRAALEMIALAIRDAAIPEALRGKEFALTLPVQFSLDDD